MIIIPKEIQDTFKKFAFRGNENLRGAGSDVDYTAEMIAEYIKCKLDPIYFITTYIQVVHPDKGVVLMDLYDYQKRMVQCYKDNKKVVFLTARQQGKTTVSAAYFVWYILFHDNKNVAILANKQSTADEIMYKVRLAYESLPHWLQQGVSNWNKRSIELENGSRVFGSATSASGIRGKTINILYIDEYAFVDNTLAEEFFTAVYPTITAGKDTQVFITPTPNGYNHFHKIWHEAEKNINGFVALRIHWYETPGRDQKWYNEQKAVLGELKAAQEIDAEFMGSSRTLLSGPTLAKLVYDLPIKEYTDQFKGLKLYKMPEKDHVYSLTVDVSRGRHLDSSAFTVFDITKYPHTISATYKNNEIAPLLYATILQKIGIQYNQAYM